MSYSDRIKEKILRKKAYWGQPQEYQSKILEQLSRVKFLIYKRSRWSCLGWKVVSATWDLFLPYKWGLYRPLNGQFSRPCLFQYLQLMERFEIALALNDRELLIPSMLPKEKPGMQLHQLQKLIRKKSDEKVWQSFTI